MPFTSATMSITLIPTKPLEQLITLRRYCNIRPKPFSPFPRNHILRIRDRMPRVPVRDGRLPGAGAIFCGCCEEYYSQ